MFSFAGKKDKNKLNPKAKLRNRGTCCVPAEHPKNQSNKDHYPINSESQARNAIARVNQHSGAPDWWKGSLKELINTVYRCVKSKYKNIELDPKKKKPGKQSAALILSLYKQAASLMNKKAKWEDMEYWGDPEDDYMMKITDYAPEERLEYYLGGGHPAQFSPTYNDENLEPEDLELKEPAFRFDPKEHIEGGGSIIGKDDAPYIEDEEGKHYDIYKKDEDILNEDEGEIDSLDEIHDDLPEFGLTKEDLEYIKDMDIDETTIRDRNDYNACDTCGYDHSYETELANNAHELIDADEMKTLIKHKK